jgi:hypothetical protein
MNKSEKYLAALTKLADKYDRDGKFELSDAVDETIKALAARPKAPLKGMDDKVKKDFLKFVNKAVDSLKESKDGLEELRRRLRYFDVADSAKGIGLDQAIEDMHSLHNGMSDANRKMFELCFGKKPSKGDLERLKNEMKEEKKDQNASDPFSFAHGVESLPETPLESEEPSEEEVKEFMGSGEEGETFEEDEGE